MSRVLPGSWPIVNAQQWHLWSFWRMILVYGGVSLVAQWSMNLPANAGDIGLIPGSGRPPGEGNGNLLQYSCLGNARSEESGSNSPWGLKESDTLFDQTTTVCLWHFPQSLAFPYKRTELAYCERAWGENGLRSADIFLWPSSPFLSLTIKKLSRWSARQWTGKKQSALWSENLFGNWDCAALGRGPWSTRNPDWCSWNSVSSDLNSILGMCLLALVVGRDTPSQGSIIPNKAGPPGVGEQKPRHVSWATVRPQTGCSEWCCFPPSSTSREGRAQSPPGKRPRSPLLTCGTAWGGFLQSFRRSVSICKIGCWFLSHRVDVRIKWDCLVRQSPQYSMNDNFYCYHC